MSSGNRGAAESSLLLPLLPARGLNYKLSKVGHEWVTPRTVPLHPCTWSGPGSAASSKHPGGREMGSKAMPLAGMRLAVGLVSLSPEEDRKQRERTDDLPSCGIQSVSKKVLAPTASLDELSTFSSAKELVKQSLGFMLTSPTALLDRGRAGTHPKNPASLLASYSIKHH